MKKTLLLFLAVLPAFCFAQGIGHTTITYTDPARSNRQIATEIYYPAASTANNVPVSPGNYPVIVFGHGFVMVYSAYQNIWNALVPQGYIVAFPTTEGSISPVHADFGADLAFLVGAIQADGNNSSSLFYQHVGTRSAIMGHSMGGGCSFLAAENNVNITTMVTLAAANTNPSSITAAAGVSIPSLVIAGQNDCVAPPAQHQVPMYDSLGSACKAYVQITGGGHCYFAETNFNCSFGEGTCTPNPTITRAEQQDAAQDMAILWLNYYLKDDCAAWDQFSDSLAVSGRFTGSVSCSVQSPVISQLSGTLQSTAAATYQWYLNGNPIAGATSQNYTPTQNGAYYVVVTYSNSCPHSSNTINFTMTGLETAPSAGGIAVFPNPAATAVTVSFFSSRANTVSIQLVDMPGQLVRKEEASVVPGMNQQVLSLDNLAPGSYLVVLHFSDGQNAFSRIVKQ